MPLLAFPPEFGPFTAEQVFGHPSDPEMASVHKHDRALVYQFANGGKVKTGKVRFNHFYVYSATLSCFLTSSRS
jgi:hypothetical protein